MSDDDGASAGRSSPPALPPESPGSSVSTRMQEEYTELLKFAMTSGLQDLQHEAEDGATEMEEAFKPIASVGSSPRQEQKEREVDPFTQQGAPDNVEVNGNTNSNNIYHDSSNESVTVPVATDVNSSFQGASTSHITVSPGVSEMGGKLDTWLGKLKGDILAELNRAVMKSCELQQKNHEQEIKDLVSEKQRLEREATRLGEQVAACEQSLARKDTLVGNLTTALQAGKDKVKLASVFYTSRAEAADQRRLTFTEKLATRHHERQLVQRVMRAWFGVIQTRWRNRVSKGCEEQARNVCAQLSQDYEDKIKSLNATVENLQQKVSFLQQERGQYAEQVRKAFMRGVCALNMETMSAFGPEEDLDLDPATGHSKPKTVPTGPASYQESDSDIQKDYSHNANTSMADPSLSQTTTAGGPGLSLGVTVLDRGGAAIHQHQLPHQQQQQGQHHQPRSLPAPEVAYTTGVIESGTVGVQHRSVPATTHKTKSKQSKTKPRPSGSAPTRHSARPAGVTNQGQPLAPPMASIVVERHNPVSKQTLGKATAVRYPKPSEGQVSRSQPSSLMNQTFKPLAGQSGSLTNMASIKVVD